MHQIIKRRLNKAWNNPFILETLLEIHFNTFSIINSTYPSRIWDKSYASYAHALAQYPVYDPYSGCIDIPLLIFWGLFPCRLYFEDYTNMVWPSKFNFKFEYDPISGCWDIPLLILWGPLPLKVFFHWRLSSIEGCLPLKVVFHWRSSSFKGFERDSWAI
jgi:hypothetical protein